MTNGGTREPIHTPLEAPPTASCMQKNQRSRRAFGGALQPQIFARWHGAPVFLTLACAQAAKARAQNRIEHSGEVDVPIRDRRAEIEKVADRKQRIMAKMVAAEHRAEAENEARQMVGADVGEDDYYMAVKAAQVAKKGKKADAKKPKLMEYLPEQTVAEGEKRGAGNFIVKNRGLVPHRSKEKKNPRVKHRKKFEKAKIKERTSFYGKQTRDDRGAYGGETTGIKAHISRSRKF